MTPSELQDAFRSAVDDLETPYLWTDSDIYRYMTAAQEQFCRLTDGISDNSSVATVVQVTTGELTAPLHRSVKKVRAATLVSTGRGIDLLNYEDLTTRRTSDYGSSLVFSLPARPGPVTAMVLGMEENTVRWLNTPIEDDEVSLLIYRLPLADVTEESQALEIDSRHHEYLIDWMRHRAHLKQDAETFDKGRSDAAKAYFVDYCEQVRREQALARHKPRLMAYGGI